MKKLSLFLFLFAAAGMGAAFAQVQDAPKVTVPQVENIVAADSTAVEQVKPEFITVTTLDGAFFNSSCGNDRLGGSKMGFINEGIILKAAEGNEELYKILLSENRYAYMPKSVVADTSVEPQVLDVISSGSMNISNIDGVDRVKINLSVRKPYMIREISNPRQIVIELFGVQNNSNWVTQYRNLKSVANVEVVQSDSDVMTIVLNLKSSTSWGYSAKYDGNTLVVDIKNTPKLSLKGMTIGVDAGHGGPSSLGAIGINSKVMEKELNLDMAYTLKAMLEAKGAKVVLSRSEDVAMTMAERKKKFLANNIDMMISIHCNAAGSTAHGASTYYKHIQNRELAKIILDNLLEIDGVNEFGLVGNFNFSLNAPTEYPAVLVETLFLSYPSDEAKLNDPDFRKLMMKKVVEGISDYLKHCKRLEK